MGEAYRRCSSLLLAVAALSSCQSDYQRVVADVQSSQQRAQAFALQSVSFAETETSPARGTKTCHVKQYTSAHLAKRRIDPTTGKVTHYGSDMSRVFARIYQNGSVGLAVTEDTYPGTNAYFLIDGRRYVADGDHYSTIDPKGIAALKRDALIQFSWTTWPYRSEANEEDVLAGFAASYQKCLAFLKQPQ